MENKYNVFIPQNIAPKNAKKLIVFNNSNEKVCSLGLGRLAPVNKTNLYSVGIISDLHFASNSVDWKPDKKVDNALTFFENNDCSFCFHAGDMTQTGFYLESDKETLNASQFDKYKEVCDKHQIPVYGICGNHDSYVKPITVNENELKDYTGNGLYFSITQGNDVFLFLGQPVGGSPMNVEELQWLYEQLEENRNKRCFVIVHPYISDDSGNALNLYGNPIFGWWSHTALFKKLLSHYKNTVLFHGHTHFMFECQELDKTTNYTEKNGFKSVHIPSVSMPRYIKDGKLITENDKSYGYLMDVYDDCIVLNGTDFINDIPVPLGILKIDTTLVEIEANTFTDDTGTITT